MATIADALVVTIKLDATGLLKSLEEVEGRLASSMKAEAALLNPPPEAASGGLAESLRQAAQGQW
jgi:hypothetical protein